MTAVFHHRGEEDVLAEIGDRFRCDLLGDRPAATGRAVSLVDACAEWFAAREDLHRSAGLIRPRLPVARDVDAQTRLLAAFGRRADWPAGT